MQVIEIGAIQLGLTVRQRWGNVFTILIAIVLMLLGLNFRDGILNAVIPFESQQAGIIAEYPANWLFDDAGNYVFRVRDMASPKYKTTFQVGVIAIGPDAKERNVGDQLTLDRLRRLTAYRVLSQQPVEINNEISGLSISYTFVSTDVSPFLQGVPTVVQGLDFLVLRGSQAIIITYRADVDQFQDELGRFERFVEGLQF